MHFDSNKRMRLTVAAQKPIFVGGVAYQKTKNMTQKRKPMCSHIPTDIFCSNIAIYNKHMSWLAN